MSGLRKTSVKTMGVTNPGEEDTLHQYYMTLFIVSSADVLPNMTRVLAVIPLNVLGM